MFTRIKQIGTRGKMVSILVLLVMVPAVFFSIYEFATLSRSEELIADVYRQQLDVVLYSINQFSWDIANSWANTISDAAAHDAVNHGNVATSITRFLDEHSGIQCIFVADSLANSANLFYPGSQNTKIPAITAREVTVSLKQQTNIIDRLFRLQESGYRKIEQMSVNDRTGGTSLVLVFVAARANGTGQIIGVVIDATRFIRDVLARKMQEAAGNNFLLSVSQKNSGKVVYSTDETLQGKARQIKDLWLFPDYAIGIRLRGQTIEEVVQARFYRNLLLIGLLNIVLIAGVWVVYRTIRHEVELAQLKSDFVSNVSHEIKTPLSLIRMFAETLQMKRVRSHAKKQEYYDTIVQESERLTRLINNILDFSRMEAGRKEYRFEPVDLNEVVNGVVRNYKTHLENEGFTVVTREEDGLPLVRADCGALSEAILNIVDNSLKYSLEQKYLGITTGIDGTTAFVEIQDHGIGIDPQQQKRIFEKFYRVSSGFVHDTKGTGLGLTLVKHIVDAHKGTIALQSEVGQGSTFRLSFPIITNAGNGRQERR